MLGVSGEQWLLHPSPEGLGSEANLLGSCRTVGEAWSLGLPTDSTAPHLSLCSTCLCLMPPAPAVDWSYCPCQTGSCLLRLCPPSCVLRGKGRLSNVQSRGSSGSRCWQLQSLPGTCLRTRLGKQALSQGAQSPSRDQQLWGKGSHVTKLGRGRWVLHNLRLQGGMTNCTPPLPP